MRGRDERVPLESPVQVDDACWRGRSRGGKRRRWSAGKTLFAAAAEVTRDGRPHKLRMSRVRGSCDAGPFAISSRARASNPTGWPASAA